VTAARPNGRPLATVWASIRLLLFVDAVDASVRAPEVAVRVVHLRDAMNLAQDLQACCLEFGGRGFDVVDAEAEHDAVV